MLEDLEINSVIKQLKKETDKKEKTTKSKSKKKEVIESVVLSEEMSSADVASLKLSHVSDDSKIGKIVKASEYNIILNEKELDSFIEQVKISGVSLQQFSTY